MWCLNLFHIIVVNVKHIIYSKNLDFLELNYSITIQQTFHCKTVPEWKMFYQILTGKWDLKCLVGLNALHDCLARSSLVPVVALRCNYV